LASHHDLALSLSQVGPSGFFFYPEGYWIGTLQPEERSYAFQEHPELRVDWDSKFGDRVTELAFVSSSPLDQEWTRRLESCLLNDIEMRMDWSKFPSPFPTFEDDEEELEGISKVENPHDHAHRSTLTTPRVHLRILSGDRLGDKR